MGKVNLPDENLFKFSFFKAGTRIFNQGDRGTDIYILKKGAVTVIVDGKIVGLINTPDTIIGEMAYFLGLNRTASVEAVEDSEFIIIPGDYLYETLFQHPGIAINLLKILAQRLANTTKYAAKLEKDIVMYRDELRTLKGMREEKKPDLGDELLYSGYIKREQLENCRNEMEEKKKKGQTVTLSRLLIEKGYLSTEKLIQFLELTQAK